MNRTALTQSQMMIWLGQQKAPLDPLYNMILCFSIDSYVDVKGFEKAFQLLVDHHDVFRLSILNNNGVPEQHFREKMTSPLMYLDYSDRENPYEDYMHWVNEDKRRVFKSDDLLYKAALIKLKDKHFVFYLKQHHLITDGWAVHLLFKQLSANYKLTISGLEHDTLKQPSFKNYAESNGFNLEIESSTYWQNRLEKPVAGLSLYGKKKSTNSSHSYRLNFSLGKKRTEALLKFSELPAVKGFTQELTLSNIFLTVISILIYKVGNQDEFGIGMAYHNRKSRNEKKTIGLFMELLPLLIRVKPTDTLLAIFKTMQLEALTVLKNNLQSKTPVELLHTFNILFNFIPISYGKFADLPTHCDWILADHVDPNHHIRLQIHDLNNTGEYHLQFDLNEEIFPNQDATFIQTHFTNILDAFMENQQLMVKDLDIITTQEIQILHSWNDTERAYPTNEILLNKFEDQAATHPEKVALVFGKKTLSYKKLNQSANKVGHFLIENKVKKNTIVALSIERSFSMMIYLYGILKAGAAFLPIATDTPKERLQFILKDANAIVFIHDNEFWINLDCSPTKNIFLPEIEDQVASYDFSKPDIRILENDLAYLLYTSGSTGQPKGVMCHHKGVCNRLNWVSEKHSILDDDVFIQKTPITFDVSFWEVFWPLQHGAKLIIEKPDGHLNPDELTKTINDHQVTMAHFVPSMLGVFITTKGVETCASLRKIFCSGEALKKHLVLATHKKLKAEVYNFYGPTEAAVEVTSWHCHRDFQGDDIPIGFPGANTKLYVLDTALNQVPIGVIGELYISGKQLAHGYLNRPELTDETFIKNPFESEISTKMYRTGDLVRYHIDGALHYIGRSDTQIKRHGLRIELGEIEKSMEAIDSIENAVVIVKNHKKQESLVGFYTGHFIDSNQIKTTLETRLPNYMVPTFFEHLPKFEMLSNGKINRKSLFEIQLNSNKENQTIAVPKNEFETIILSIWQKVLGEDDIDVEEEFTRIGGNSLNAMVITSRLKEAFELSQLTLVDVFKYPSIRLYAAFIEQTIMNLMKGLE